MRTGAAVRTRLPGGLSLRRDGGSALVIVVGAMLLRLALTSTYQRYVKPSYRPELLAAALVLIALGVLGLARSLRSASARVEPADAGDHEHAGHTPAVALLLLLPVVAVFLVTPPPLGVYAAERSKRVSDQLHPPAALPPAVDGAVPLSVAELVDRVSVGQDLTSGTYRLRGFVTSTPGGEDAAYHLTRLQIVCCAADAQSVSIAVVGDAGSHLAGDWLEVTGSEVVRDDGTPALQVQSVTGIPEPNDPYGQ